MRRSGGLILMASLAVATLSACSITFGEARTSEDSACDTDGLGAAEH